MAFSSGSREDGQTNAGVTAGYVRQRPLGSRWARHALPARGCVPVQAAGPQTVAQARYQYGHAFVRNNDDYLQEHLGQLSLTHTWQKNGTTFLLAASYPTICASGTPRSRTTRAATRSTVEDPAPNEIGRSPPGVDERNARDRDGIGYGAAIEHRYLVPLPNGIDDLFEGVEIGAGYRFGFYDSEGEEWEHFSNRADGDPRG